MKSEDKMPAHTYFTCPVLVVAVKLMEAQNDPERVKHYAKVANKLMVQSGGKPRFSGSAMDMKQQATGYYMDRRDYLVTQMEMEAISR